VDISVITSGVASRRRLDALLDAGMDRANVSVHGWSPEAFAERGGSARAHAVRQAFIEHLVGLGRPVKVNFVYTGAGCEADLTALLDWAAPRPVVVGLLDDLSNPAASARTVLEAMHRLRGAWVAERRHDDPDCLPTARLEFADGLEVEVKTSVLGQVAPWQACDGCPARTRCREGTHALRLGHDGRLRACMDRQDVALDLCPQLARGEANAAAAWRRFVHKEAA